jgi:hypothetical protein
MGRVLEWARPPDPYDRAFVKEPQRVRVHGHAGGGDAPGEGVARRGGRGREAVKAGRRLRHRMGGGEHAKGTHKSRVRVLAVLKSSASCAFALACRAQLVLRAAQRQFDRSERRASAAYRALQKHHRRRGTLCPPAPAKLSSQDRPQPARPGEEDIKTAQLCAAVAHLAEVGASKKTQVTNLNFDSAQNW